MLKNLITSLVKRKVPEKVVAMSLITTMVLANVLVLGTYFFSGKAYAAGVLDITNQTNKTQSENVEFEVGSADAEVMEWTNIRNKMMYLTIDVKESGYLKDGKITFQNENFSMLSSTYQIEEIKKVNTARKEITFNQINPSTLILEVPIGFPDNEKFNLSHFNQNSVAVFTGIYVDENGKEIEIHKEYAFPIEWDGTATAILSAEPTIYKPYQDGTLLQYKLSSTLKGREEKQVATLPIAKTDIFVEVPQIDGIYPTNVKVSALSTNATNGKTGNIVQFHSMS